MTTISEIELRQRLSQVKLLAIDVDGVMTDGGLYYTDSGEVIKKFNVQDGQGLKLLMQAGIEVAIISANSSAATLYRAKTLGIVHTFLGIEDKLTVLNDLCQKLNLSLSQVAYAGDDINDLPVLQVVGCPFTVANAISINKTYAIYVTSLLGGQGAVRELCDLLISISNPTK